MASQLVQLKNGSDSLYVKNPDLVDISSNFVPLSTAFRSSIYATYDRTAGTVRGNFYIQSPADSLFSTNTNLFTIDAAYRPSAGKTRPALIGVTASGETTISVYTITIRSDGGIRQGLSGSCRWVYAYFEYTV